MQLGLSEEQELLQQTFAELFGAESSPDRVRAAESTGFDPGLWKHLVETGAIAIRVPEGLGGSGAGLHDAAILAEQAGRALASVPLVEAICAAGLLARIETDAARALVAEILEGGCVPTLALREGERSSAQLDSGRCRRRRGARARRRRTGAAAPTELRRAAPGREPGIERARALAARRSASRWRARRSRARGGRAQRRSRSAGGMAAAHRRRAHGPGAARARDRRRLREVADPVRSPDRLVPGHRAPVRQCRNRCGGVASARAVRDLVARDEAARGRRADLLRVRGGGRVGGHRDVARAPRARRLRPVVGIRHPALLPAREGVGACGWQPARRADARDGDAVRRRSGARRAARRRPVRARLHAGGGRRANPRRGARLLRTRAHARAAREGALQLRRLRRRLPEAACERGPAVPALAARLWRPGAEPVRDDGALGGVSPRRLVDPCRDDDGNGRRDADPVRQRGAQARGAAADPRGRGDRPASATRSPARARTSPRPRRAPCGTATTG